MHIDYYYLFFGKQFAPFTCDLLIKMPIFDEVFSYQHKNNVRLSVDAHEILD
jgi:hypothetical protein